MSEISRAGFGAAQLIEAQLPLRELRKIVFGGDLKEAGFSAAQLKQEGFSADGSTTLVVVSNLQISGQRDLA